MATDAQRAAVRRYDAAHTRMYAIKLNMQTDADIIGRLDTQNNVQGYIKRAIRRDMEMEGEK